MGRNSDDIDQLIAELHASAGAPGRRGDRRHQPARSAGCGCWPTRAAATCCSSPARRRRSASRDGSARSPEGPLDGVDIEEAVLPALAPHARRIYRDAQIADGSFRVQGLGRFRINLHRERGRAAAALRALPARVPRLATLGPAAERRAADAPAARPRPHRRSDRIGQDDDAGGAGGRDQPARRPPHRHDRGSDRVRAPASCRASSSRSRSASTRPTFRPRCAPRCARRPTSSSSARCAIPRRCGSRWRRPRPGIWCCRRCTRPTPRRRSARIADSFPDERQNTIRQELSMALAAVMTQTLLPEDRRRPGAGGGAADGQLRRAAAHPQERAAAPASGDDDHAEARVVHARGIAGAAREAGPGRAPATRSRAPRTSRSWSSCSAESRLATAWKMLCARAAYVRASCRLFRRQLMQMFRRIPRYYARGDARALPPRGRSRPMSSTSRRSTRRSSSASARIRRIAKRFAASCRIRTVKSVAAKAGLSDRARRSGRVDAPGRRSASGREPGPRRQPGPRRRRDRRHHDDDDHHHPAGRHPDHRASLSAT